eukprot:2224298-Lingulodinium_polyedra.AAC.1
MLLVRDAGNVESHGDGGGGDGDWDGVLGSCGGRLLPASRVGQTNNPTDEILINICPEERGQRPGTPQLLEHAELGFHPPQLCLAIA